MTRSKVYVVTKLSIMGRFDVPSGDLGKCTSFNTASSWFMDQSKCIHTILIGNDHSVVEHREQMALSKHPPFSIIMASKMLGLSSADHMPMPGLSGFT